MEDLLRDVIHEVAVFIPRIGLGTVIFAAFWFAGVMLRRLLLRFSHGADFNTRFVVRLLARTASVALIVFGAVSALGTMGINVSALVAGLGLTGFALGFALKDVLSNFIAGVLILLYRPFELNDYVSVSGLEGTVTEIDLRYTTLEKQGQKFLIPNSILFTNSIGLTQQKPGNDAGS
jgi:small-conductance mechanosensitive channel